MPGDLLKHRRAFSRGRRAATSVCVVALVASLAAHYVLWTTRARGPLDLLPTTAAPRVARALGARVAAVRDAAKEPVAKEGCEDGTRAVAKDGSPCMDLKRAMWAQLIYITNTSKVQYLYCGIPKNGCTYHLALQRRIQGASNYEASYVIHSRKRKSEGTIFSRNSADIARMLQNASLPKYMVVRNPLRRTLSAYLDKVQPALPEVNRTVEAFHEWVFEEFPQDAPEEARGWKGMNPHWRPQLEFCGYKVRDVQKYFNVFRVEEPEEYVNFLYETVPGEFLDDGWAWRQNLTFREHVLGPRRRTGNTDEKTLKYYNTFEVFDHVASVLADDIRVLGYSDEVTEMREALSRRLGVVEGQ